MSNFGKLIISRCNDYYETFHDLDLILVKGNGNKIDIDQDIVKLVINGPGNKISIKSNADIGKITIRWNHNKIYSFYSSSLNNLSDFGHRNNIYYREDDESDEENSFSNDGDENDVDDDEQISQILNQNSDALNELILQIATQRLRQHGLLIQENAQLNNEENHILNESLMFNLKMFQKMLKKEMKNVLFVMKISLKMKILKWPVVSICSILIVLKNGFKVKIDQSNHLIVQFVEENYNFVLFN